MAQTTDGVEVCKGLRVFTNDAAWGTVTGPTLGTPEWFDVAYDEDGPQAGRVAMLNGERMATRSPFGDSDPHPVSTTGRGATSRRKEGHMARKRQPQPKQAQPEVEVVDQAKVEKAVKLRQGGQTLAEIRKATGLSSAQVKEATLGVKPDPKPETPSKPKAERKLAQTKAAAKIGQDASPLLKAKAAGPDELREFVRQVWADSVYNGGTLSNVKLGEKYGIGDSTARKIAYGLIFAEHMSDLLASPKARANRPKAA